MDKLPIQEYKDDLGDRARDIILSSKGITFNSKKNVRCFNPTHDDKHPSMGWDSNANHFHCFSCNYTYDIYNHYEEQGYTFIEAINKVAEQIGRTTFTNEIVEDDVKKDLSATENKDIRYLEKRGMSKDTIFHFGVKDLGSEIAFVYHGLDADIVGVKYRGVKSKRFRAESGSQFNLYNMVNVSIGGELIITEGEIDAMTVYECGFDNVVSIPTGAGSTNWITDNWDWLENFESFVVIFDNDEAGQSGLKETIGRLGEQRVKVAELPLNKDVNDVYTDEARDFYKENKSEDMTDEEQTHLMKEAFKYSQVIVNDIIERADFIPIDGLQNFDDINMSNAESEYYISTGFSGIDYHLNDLQPGEITVVFGRENEGKTTWIGQIIANIVNSGEKVFWYNGEMKLKKLKTWLYSQVIGESGEGEYYRLIQHNKRTRKEFKSEVLEALKQWHHNKIYLLNSPDVTSHEDIYSKIVASYKQKGTKIVIIDNLASILDASGDNMNAIETNFIKRLNKIKKKYNMHFIVVGHPNGYKGKGELLESVDLSGSKNIPNLIDNMISVMRIYKNEDGERELNGKIYDEEISLRTDVIKDRSLSMRKSYYYKFNRKSKRFIELADTPTGKRWEVHNYDWEQYLEKELEFYNGNTQKMSKGNLEKITGGK